MKVLVIDDVGVHVKLLATGHKQGVEFHSGPKMTPAKMVAATRATTVGWKYDAVSIVKRLIFQHEARRFTICPE